MLRDPSPAQRELWLEDWYGAGERPLRIDRTDLDEPSFVVLGDTGEGDVSQYAAVPVLAQVGRDTDFMVICSDVIYPAGEVEEYDVQVLPPVPRLPRADLRAARQPRLVRRTARLHVPLLRAARQAPRAPAP